MQIVPDTFLTNAGVRTGVFLLVSNDRQLLIPEARKFADSLNPLSASDAVLNTLILFPEDGAYTIDTLRDFIAFETRVPVNASAKTLILHSVDCLTDKQADVLLKTIEEPRPFSLIIMTAEDESHVRGTVASRAMIFRHHVKDEDIPMTYQMFRQMAESGDVLKAAEGIKGAGIPFFINAVLSTMTCEEDRWIAKTAQMMLKTNISDGEAALFMARAFLASVQYKDRLRDFVGEEQ